MPYGEDLYGDLLFGVDQVAGNSIVFDGPSPGGGVGVGTPDEFGAFDSPTPAQADAVTDTITFAQTSGAAPGIIDWKENLFAPSNYDGTLYMGYNQDANGNVVVATEPGFSWCIEGDYDQAGTHVMEAYLQWRSAGNVTSARPIFIQVNRTTGVGTALSLVSPDIRFQGDATPSNMFRWSASGGNGYFEVFCSNFGVDPPVMTVLKSTATGIVRIGDAANGSCFQLETGGANAWYMKVGGKSLLYGYALGSGIAVSIGGTNDNSNVLLVDNAAGYADHPVIVARRRAAQTADIFQAQSEGSAVYGGFDKGGYWFTKKNAAPADADLVAGQAMLWFDQTNGASKLMVKAKQADGTVKTASVALA